MSFRYGYTRPHLVSLTWRVPTTGIDSYSDRAAATTAMSARVSENAYVSIGIGIGIGIGLSSGEVGARGGFQTEWWDDSAQSGRDRRLVGQMPGWRGWAV